MEEKDERLIQSLLEREPELRRYYDEHVDLERRLETYQQKLYLTPDEEIEKKRLQKLKLAGKGVKKAAKDVSGSGKKNLRVRAKGRKKAKLKKKGKATVRARVRYIPDTGSPDTESKRIKLIRRR